MKDFHDATIPYSNELEAWKSLNGLWRSYSKAAVINDVIKPFLGDLVHIIYRVDIYTGWAKSQYPYVGLYSSVTECPIEIILSGMTYYHHWFKEFVKSKHIYVHCFQMKVHFRIYLIVLIAGLSQILLNGVLPFKLRLS